MLPAAHDAAPLDDRERHGAELTTLLDGCYAVESPFLADLEEVTRTLDALAIAELRATLAEPGS